MGDKKEDQAPYIATKELGELDMVKCPKCKSIHFRHAGNVMIHRTYVRNDKQTVGDTPNGDIDLNSYLVYICIRCANPWVQVGDQLFDAIEHIDVAKFDRVNKALQADTHTDPHC